MTKQDVITEIELAEDELLTQKEDALKIELESILDNPAALEAAIQKGEVDNDRKMLLLYFAIKEDQPDAWNESMRVILISGVNNINAEVRGDHLLEECFLWGDTRSYLTLLRYGATPSEELLRDIMTGCEIWPDDTDHSSGVAAWLEPIFDTKAITPELLSKYIFYVFGHKHEYRMLFKALHYGIDLNARNKNDKSLLQTVLEIQLRTDDDDDDDDDGEEESDSKYKQYEKNEAHAAAECIRLLLRYDMPARKKIVYDAVNNFIDNPTLKLIFEELWKTSKI